MELDQTRKERDAARAEVATLQAERDALRAKLAVATAKPVVAAPKPLDVVALIEGAHGAEKMRLYAIHKKEYDAAKR
jgi:hypothetical protein